MALLAALRRTNRVIAPCSFRSLATAASHGVDVEPRAPRQTRPPKISINTLNPLRLQPSDFVDLSNRRAPTYSIRGRPYPRGNRLGYAAANSKRFPDGTQGFFYYHPPTPPETILGELRFRVTSSADPATFSSGSDLRTLDGEPWGILPAFLGPSAYHGSTLGQLLLDERLVTQAQRELWDKLPYRRNPVSVVTQFGEPFAVSFGNSVFSHWVVTPKGVQAHRFMNRTCWRVRRDVFRAVVRGDALVSWELSSLPIHEGRRVAVLRMVKALTEVKLVAEYEGTMPMPVEGALIYVRANKPWALDLSEDTCSSRSLRLLLPD
ncbi:hypothetical protein BV25DRAFT_1914229 [Artomyces pyxidatus]|uniref:Uncharacterized protein n=1 Tax=Artomyces pyxidatus TaxID=48021 RepID=A0ACB8T949_9AGAM|nr:hypothetical protein BV25DRAFT_1914229 [Artomyces pyxidatus]